MSRRIGAGAVAVLAMMAVCGGSARAADEKPGAKAEGHGKHMPPGQGWQALSAEFDANKDGKITKDEFKAKAPAFDRMDANKDGKVTKAEVEALPAAQKHPGASNFISRFDADGNGEVTRDEWNAKRAGAFDKADKNHDGAIDKDEAMAAGKSLNATD